VAETSRLFAGRGPRTGESVRPRLRNSALSAEVARRGRSGLYERRTSCASRGGRRPPHYRTEPAVRVRIRDQPRPFAHGSYSDRAARVLTGWRSIRDTWVGERKFDAEHRVGVSTESIRRRDPNLRSLIRLNHGRPLRARSRRASFDTRPSALDETRKKSPLIANMVVRARRPQVDTSKPAPLSHGAYPPLRRIRSCDHGICFTRVAEGHRRNSTRTQYAARNRAGLLWLGGLALPAKSPTQRSYDCWSRFRRLPEFRFG
jgi:hypothetical protein